MPSRNDDVDLLVIGGGIVGAGVARDAAMRGLRVLLVEQHDFAFGTSSRSSRLLHGGLRYLAQGRIGLVREASREKRILQRIAPHLAQPLVFVFPIYPGSGWPRWKLRLGVWLYDRLCVGGNLGKSRSLGVRETLDHLPHLREQGLRGAVSYYDGMTNDARLVIDTLRSASQHGAQLCNYVRFLDAHRSGGNQQLAPWTCLLRGLRDERAVEVRARTIVNATGPWSAGLPHSKTRLRLTKGVHLVVDRSRLPVPDAVVMTEGRRILFAIPWGERVILGTTDTDYDGPTDRPTCDARDMRYVLDVVNDAFPSAGLSAADVISTWAGLRPLVDDGHGRPSDISRRHQIAMPQPGWLDVTGGKLTTYRLIAEQTVDRVCEHLPANFSKCETARAPLLAEADTGGVSGIIPPPVTREVVEHFCSNEWAVHLDDVMVRRTSWRHYHADHLAIARRVATWMAECLDWSETRVREEMRRYRELTGAASSPGGSSADDGENPACDTQREA